MVHDRGVTQGSARVEHGGTETAAGEFAWREAKTRAEGLDEGLNDRYWLRRRGTRYR